MHIVLLLNCVLHGAGSGVIVAILLDGDAYALHFLK